MTTDDRIRVTVPARPELVHVLRSVAASVGARLSLSIDSVEEVRIAVDEAAILLLGLAESPLSSLELIMERPTVGLAARLSIAPALPAPQPEVLHRSWSWRVMSGLCDEVVLELSEDSASIRFTKADGDGSSR